MNKYGLLLCCMLSVLTLRSADRPAISCLGIEQGLSNNSITCIFQDHSGLMWFGTYDGLNRYDGYNFKIFRNKLNDKNSLPNNRIADITEDSKHRIWIGTRVGVGFYDQVTSTITTIKYIPAGESVPKKMTSLVNDINIDATGNIFIATDDGLRVCTEENTLASTVLIATASGDRKSYQALSVEFDRRGRVWVYIRDLGLCLLNNVSHKLELVNSEIKNGNCLKSDSYGKLWMAADDGLYDYSITGNTFSKLFSSGARIVQISGKGELNFLSTDGNGVFLYNDATRTTVPLIAAPGKPDLTSMAISSVLTDKDGRIWIGTLRGGINVIDPVKNRFQTISHDPMSANSLIGNFVVSFAEDKEGNMWIGSDGSGISCWNRKRNTFTNYHHDDSDPGSLSNNAVTYILKDDQNDIWIATWGGSINRFNRKTNSFEHFKLTRGENGKEDKNAFFLYQDRQNKLWAGNCLEGGLYFFNRKAGKFELFDERLKNIITMAEDRQGNLWAGDFSSLIQIDPVSKKNQRYEIGYAIRSILDDKNGNFWIGTEGGGLLLFDRTNGKYFRFTDKEGLANNSILNILADRKNNLWISTFNGLSRFNISTRKFVNFSQSDGLQSNQFSYNAGLVLQSGEFAFGGIKGLNIFHPDSILNAPPPLNVLLTGLKINNVSLQEENSFEIKRTNDRIESITVPFNKAVLAIDFVALNYSGSDKIKYAYYLEGWDKGWNNVGKIRTAYYTRLNEGTYIFHVKAVDAAGNWTELKQNLEIKVLPPWYRSWWAYLIYMAAVASLIYLYDQYRTQRSRQVYEIALAKMAMENEKELNEKKLSFFTNISHEFRAPLTLIIDPVKELLYHPEKRASTADLHIVYRNARRLLSLVDQLLLFRKAESYTNQLKTSRINLYEFCQEVFICFSQQAKSRNIHYLFSGVDQSVQLVADREKMEIILFNLLSNALKFTPTGGTVQMELLQNIDRAEIIVSDTGPGIDPTIGDQLFEKFYQVNKTDWNAHKGFGIGLYLTKQFVQAHQGTIRYESQSGQGTKFIISFPVDLRESQTETSSIITAQPNPGKKMPVIIEELMADLEAEIEEGQLLSTKSGPDGKKFQKSVPDIVSEKKSILLVDDNTGIRQYLSQIFDEKFLIYEAEDGESGLEMAVSHMPDIIISDIFMKGMTGVEFCQKIKSDPDLNHIPVILLTATTSPEMKLKGIECGAEDFITKPFEKDFLTARVDNILRNRNTLQQYFLDTVTLRKNKTKVSAAHRSFLDHCIATVEKHIEDEEFSIKTFAREMGMSHSNLYKKVKSVSGLSINAFIRFLRLRKAALILLSSDTNINEAAFQVGMNDPKYFREQFFKLFGMNPSDYVKKYKDSFNKEFNIVI